MIKTFNEYQQEANFLKISLDKFLENHPNLPEDVVLLLRVAYDGLGLGEAGEVQGKIKKIIRDDGGNITPEHIEAPSLLARLLSRAKHSEGLALVAVQEAMWWRERIQPPLQ